MNEEASPELNIKKYRIAGIGFFVLNLISLAVFMIFLPPMGFGASAYLSIAAYIFLMGFLAWMIAGGRRTFTLVCAVIFAIRLMISVRQMIVGEAFEAVPYILPCLILTFYLLGRAVWDWP